MEFVTLGTSNVKVTRIIFGAWAIGGWMWGGADRKDAIKAIHKSLDLGISSIDTAPVYGFGLSEEIVGEAIKGLRTEVQILTKYGLVWDRKIGDFYFSTFNNDGKPVSIYKHAGKESIIHECEQSLSRLKTDYLDLYQIHWPAPSTPIEETMDAMNRLIKDGKIRSAGVCNYSVEEMEVAETTINLVSNQVPYSMVRRDIENDLIPWCMKHHKSILAYSPLQRGLLTGKFRTGQHFVPGDTRPDTPWFKGKNLVKTNKFLEEIKPLAISKNFTVAQLVLRWTMQMPGITTVLAGARNARQVEENAGAFNFTLTEKEMCEINLKLDRLELEL
ncbi:MAG: aldo/keto reductase [Bacteroides sp. SM23_62_1]|nr:MAG: aldo/keto reductase [Bacteroides sp. SM23_62_1]